MRLETKFVQVPNEPNTINAINNLAAVWGWTVQNIQVTDTKITREGDSFGWVTDYGAYIEKEIITEHTNYASITYQRDMDHPHYSKLSALEREYNTCSSSDILTTDELKTIKTFDSFNLLWKVAIALCCIVAFLSGIFQSLLGSFLYQFLSKATLIGVIAIPLVVWLAPPIRKLRKEAGDLSTKGYNYKNTRKAEIINIAKSL